MGISHLKRQNGHIASLAFGHRLCAIGFKQHSQRAAALRRRWTGSAEPAGVAEGGGAGGRRSSGLAMPASMHALQKQPHRNNLTDSALPRFVLKLMRLHYDQIIVIIQPKSNRIADVCVAVERRMVPYILSFSSTSFNNNIMYQS